MKKRQILKLLKNIDNHKENAAYIINRHFYITHKKDIYKLYKWRQYYISSSTDKLILKIFHYRFWRSLLRVVSYDNYCVDLMIPSWSTEKIIRKPISILPKNIRKNLKTVEYRFHADVNLDAETVSLIIIKNIGE